MTPYIVKGAVFARRYMSYTTTLDDIRIVMANNKDEAIQKYEKYWEDKSEDYGTSYDVAANVVETIV